jgi:hypothetical protein
MTSGSSSQWCIIVNSPPRFAGLADVDRASLGHRPSMAKSASSSLISRSVIWSPTSRFVAAPGPGDSSGAASDPWSGEALADAPALARPR